MLYVALLSLTALGQNRPASDNPMKTSLDSLVDQAALAFMSSGSRVGLSIGIINNGTTFFYNYGSTNRETKVLPTSATVYELASISKTFSATLLAKAIVAKKVNANDDIRKYLNEQYPNLSYKGTPVSLLNLTNLTSALPNWMPDNSALFSKANVDSIPFLLDAVHDNYSRKQFYTDLHQVRLDTLPGVVARHCNTAAQLLGHIMETVYAKKFDQLLRDEFSVPLKMRSTVLLAKGKVPKAMASGYDGKGRLMPYIDWEDLQVAASIASSTADMMKYMAYQLDESNPVIKLSHQPTFGKMEDGAIAYNWKINRSPQNAIKIAHTGGSLGFSSYMSFSPALQSGIILLSNQADQGAQNELIKLAKVISGY